MRVLVIDDSALIRSRLVAMLREVSGVKLCEATDPEEARRALSVSPADLVVLDISVARGAGLELIREIKAARPSVTLVVLTNEATEAHRRGCLASGADFFFDKSRQFEGALSVVSESALARPRAERRT